MSQDKFSRRSLLAGLGASVALLPWLETDRVHAGCLSAPPRRAIFLSWPNAVIQWAAGSETGFTLPETLSSLEGVRDDLLLVRGVRYQNLIDTPNPQRADNVGHGTPCGLLSGTRYATLVPFRMEAGGPTVDQHIAQELSKQGKHSGRTLHLGVRHEGYQFVWRQRSQPVPPDNDPYHAFDSLFAGVTTGTAPDPAVARLRLTRRSILDRVHKDLDRFCRNLGGDDRSRCDAHLTSIRELEQQLAAGSGAVEGCTVPALGNRINPNNNDDTPTIFKLQMDIMVAAMAADVVRTGVITFGNEGNNHVIPSWLGFAKTGVDTGTGDSNSHHSIAHAAGDNPTTDNGKRKVAVDRWLYSQMAYLVERLRDEREGSGTMLQNTVVVSNNNMDNGGGHGIHNVPWLLAGQCGGYFRTGRNLGVSDVQHTDILNAVCDAMGVDIDGYTDAEYRGRLAGLR